MVYIVRKKPPASLDSLSERVVGMAAVSRPCSFSCCLSCCADCWAGQWQHQEPHTAISGQALEPLQVQWTTKSSELLVQTSKNYFKMHHAVL